jgi:VanZ family protein
MMQRWGRFRDWLPAIVWACVISSLSTDTFSADHTGRFIIPVLRGVFPHASYPSILLMHALIRKSAHFVEYFIFSVFLTHGLRGEERGWKLRWALWAVGIAAGYAALDEFHQWFVPGRTASPWDALLDTTGAAVAQMILWRWRTREPRPAANEGSEERAVSGPG